jgi:hypothetical protein
LIKLPHKPLKNNNINLKPKKMKKLFLMLAIVAIAFTNMNATYISQAYVCAAYPTPDAYDAGEYITFSEPQTRDFYITLDICSANSYNEYDSQSYAEATTTVYPYYGGFEEEELIVHPIDYLCYPKPITEKPTYIRNYVNISSYQAEVHVHNSSYGAWGFASATIRVY